MIKLNLLYEGKAKQIYATENENQVILYYKDDATAFNGEKKESIASKGVLNNYITSIIFEMLEKNQIKTHFVQRLNDREQLCEKVEIIPLEVIVRNIVTGSMSKRLGLKDGYIPKTTVFEFCYKDDSLGDPLINSYHAVALGIITFEEVEQILKLTSKINDLLKEFFNKINVNLIDFKIEFGKNKDGEIILADEISPDSCRLWDIHTGEKLDKDLFRKNLGDIKQAYSEILSRIKGE